MSLKPRKRVRSSSIEASNVISSNCADLDLENAQTMRNATWPPEASIHVNCSSMSFSKTAQTSASHSPHCAPWGRKLESQNVIMANARSNMD